MKRRADRTSDSAAVQRPRRSRRDEGSSFIEVLVSIVLLGIASIAVLTSMASAIRGGSTHDKLATVQANLSDAGDHLTDVTFGNDTYEACGAAAGAYQAAVNTWQVTVDSVTFWNGTTFDTACSGDEMQRISLRATIDGLERELVVVKRKATTAPTAGGAWNDGMVTPLPNPNLP